MRARRPKNEDIHHHRRRQRHGQKQPDGVLKTQTTDLGIIIDVGKITAQNGGSGAAYKEKEVCLMPIGYKMDVLAAQRMQAIAPTDYARTRYYQSAQYSL